MNIDDLMQPLPVTENPGIDSVDPRFIEITTMVQNADYAGAAAQANEILDEGIYDIRIIVFYLYDLFAEQGPAGLGMVLSCLAGLLTQNWEAVGPVAKREKHAQTSIGWLMKQILKKLQYEESTKGETWGRWVAEISSDQAQEALDSAGNLQRALGIVLEEGSRPILDGLTKITGWLKGFQQVVYRESEPEPEPAEEATPSDEAGIPAPRSSEATTHARMTPSAASGEEPILVEGSYYLKVLVRKLKAFEQLVEEQKFSKAAIVVNDINMILADFDPKLFFPKLFTRYSYLLATNISELAEYDEQKETLEWHALEEFYKVDIDGFIDL